MCNELPIGLNPHKYPNIKQVSCDYSFGLMTKVLMREGMSWESVLRLKHNLASVEKCVPTFSSWSSSLGVSKIFGTKM